MALPHFNSLWLPFLLIGLSAFFKGLSFYRQFRQIVITPTSKIHSLAVGFVEVHGRIKPKDGEVLKSSFTERDCVYCKSTVNEFAKNESGNGISWRNVVLRDAARPFFVEDETGCVEVDPTYAEFWVPRNYSKTFYLGQSLPPQVQKLYDNDARTRRVFFSSLVRCFGESFLAPGDVVHVSGTATIKPNASSEKHENLLVIKSKCDQTLRISSLLEDASSNLLLRNAIFLILAGVAAISIGLYVFLNKF